MMHEIVHKTGERALLVGLVLPGRQPADEETSLDELASLTEAAGSEVAERLLQNRKAPDAATYIGPGKADEIRRLLGRKRINAVVFNDDLSPAQIKNLETVFERRVADRSTIILDIFHRRARSRQAKLQVELARLTYLLPRLTRQWQHLERQNGGYGLRGGPGEKQLELDRRMARKRIADVTADLARVQRRTETAAASRKKAFRVALVGYTNAGKSTLFNHLTGHRTVIARDQLFTTLDTTVRKLTHTKGEDIVLSDTVGFISRLPDHLLDAFHSTLHEVTEADLILHVIDVTCRHIDERIESVSQVLDSLGVSGIPVIRVLNKADMVEDPVMLKRVQRKWPEGVIISAARERGLDRLREVLEEEVDRSRQTVTLLCSHAQQKLLTNVYHNAEILFRKDTEDGVMLYIRAREEQVRRFKKSGLLEIPS